MSTLTEIQSFAQELQLRYPWAKHDFFKEMQINTNREKFLRAQKSFIYAVDHWSKQLAFLITKVPYIWQRQLILENLCDENGFSESNRSKTHVQTFYEYLLALGISSLPQHISIDSPTRRFIQNLQKAEERSWIFFAATLAMIEFSYIEVSQRISHKLELSNWLEQPQEHYSSHEVLDRKHADDLFKVIEGQSVKIIQSGLKYGYKIFRRYYKELYYKYLR